jgi:MFS family permease
MALLSMLSITVIGTASNNLLSVPLHAIADDFGAPIPLAVLTISVFLLTFAVGMPIAGWLGDHFGHRKTTIAAMALLAVSQLAAAVAPNLPFLIGTRAVQGLACSATPPVVMALLSHLYPDRRARMMGLWASANGVGHALGPPLGGIGSDLIGWRLTFVVIAACSVTCMLGVIRSVPSIPHSAVAIDVRGAVTLVGGAAFTLGNLITLRSSDLPVWVHLACAAVGIVLLVLWALDARGNPRPLVPPQYFRDPAYLRSCICTFMQMFTFGTVLVAIPLHLVRTVGLSSSLAGVTFFLLPLAMVVCAPVAGRAAGKHGIAWVLRVGFAAVLVGGLSAGLLTQSTSGDASLLPLVLVLVVLGSAMAMVHSAAAAGVMLSSAGTHGGALGMFNLLRFSGSTSGAAWVAVMYPTSHMLAMYLGCVALGLVGLGATFLRVGPRAPVGPTATAG